jgi:pimeloyl-ACP methyl ester carboxylesterase
MSSSRPLALGALLVAALCGTGGCALLELSKVRESERVDALYAYVAGTVAADLPKPEWMVVYVTVVPCDEDWSAVLEAMQSGEATRPQQEWSEDLRALGERIREKASIVEHIVLQKPGFWYAELAPGCYAVGAFADLNQNYRYDDEPVAPAIAQLDRIFELRPGDRREGIDLRIDPDARLVEDFDPVASQIRPGDLRSHEEQLIVSLGEVAVLGEIADLSDPHFGQENARLGYFEIFRFLWQVRPGIYFLEPYDPARVPVLFVHGALGNPQEFAPLIERLDPTRFQAWVYYYPSGAPLEPVGEFLARSVTSLQLRHGFEELAIVAHSMGGLVSRDAILRYHDIVVDDPMRLLVSISTPWAGVPSAEKGASRSPYVVPSWRDIAPRSDYLARLFFEDSAQRMQRRRLPDQVTFHLLFGVDDETIPRPSAIRWEALRDADQRWPLPYDHTSILKSPEAAQLLREVLASEFR